jgi:succinate dehydrogenase / fumarate reductase iron-sulfur subunit
MPELGASQIRVRVLRSDPAGGREPSWSEYETALVPGESVTGILWNINEQQAGSLAYRVSCHRGICASCIMKINGKQRLGCVTEVTGDLELAPAFGTVIKDLVVEQG